MKILVDSNVVIDFLSDREEFSDEAEKIFLFGHVTGHANSYLHQL